MLNLEDKTVLLTGASGGIGREIARKLAASGARLILVGRTKQSLGQIRQSISNAGRHTILCADIGTPSGRSQVVQAVEAAPGYLDILINNAGVSDFNFLKDQSPDVIENLFNINLLSPVLLTRQLLPLLRKQPRAMILNIGSSLGSIGFPGYASYCASKFGLRGFTESLRRELADTGIDVMYIAPRATTTTINSHRVVSMNQALGNAMDSPEHVAGIVVKSIIRNKPRTYIGRPEQFFIRLNSILPRVVDDALRRKLPTIRSFLTS